MDPPDKPAGPPTAPPSPPKPNPGNPAFRAMGLPAFRAKLPSRNWLIFLSLSTALGLAITYDRREAKRAQQRWCSAVEHLSRQPLGTLELPRKVTVYLSAPPGDGISPSREHFREYVKPVFTAAALEFDVVEGRRDGELRWRVAERVRKERQGGGDGGEVEAVEEVRRKNGTRRLGVQGDVVVGRHAWKEYIRGIHEGWLGPLEHPPPPPTTTTTAAQFPDNNNDGATLKPEGGENGHKNPPDQEEIAATTTTTTTTNNTNTTKPTVPHPYISPKSYQSTTTLPENIPKTLPPVALIPHPHILGFLNAPLRLYRFLTSRHTADAVGRQAAAIALAAHVPFDVAGGEIERCGQGEEKDWPKKTWKDKDGEGEGEGGEGLEIAQEVVVDYRIGERMRRFVPPPPPSPHLLPLEDQGAVGEKEGGLK